MDPSMEKDSATTPFMTPQQERFASEKISPLQLYRELVVGEGTSWLELLRYELIFGALSGMAGLPGFGLRSMLYPFIFGSWGTKSAIGRHVLLRCPKQISLGRNVRVDDQAVLDVRGVDSRIDLADFTCIGRFTTMAAKGGSISCGKAANIGSYCRIATQSRISIGESVLIAAYCYIGPGNHQQADYAEGEAPSALISRPMEIKGGVTIGAHAWIGTRSTIVDGVNIGERAVVGAHSLVREDVPAGAVVAGSPARLLRIS